jgi:hypothetical protein
VIEAPDYCEPVVGWRLWAVVSDGGSARLVSPMCPSMWRPECEVVAVCDLHPRERLRPWRRRPTVHTAPGDHCTCGLHAMVRPGYLATYMPPSFSRRVVHRVVGRVALWGRVFEGTRGWRASHAYPAELWVPRVELDGELVADAGSAAIGLADYGVPVHVCEGMTDREVVETLARTSSPRGVGMAA